jgi:flagellar biosynthesis/type III secretory pathway protein FliH
MADAAAPFRMPHCFPLLTDVDLPDEPEKNSCELFRPLFCDISESGPAQAPKVESEKDESPDRQLIEEARERGFQGGLVLGKAEACRIAKAALTPELQDFAGRIRDFSDFTVRATTACASRIVNLTVAIAGHILGEELSFSINELDHLQAELQNALAGTYRLTVVMHPRDREALEQLIAAEACEWPMPLAVDIQTDADIPSGSINACQNEDQLGILEEMACKKIADLLRQAHA